ncbi:MAG: hypothetical protein KY454_04320 [Actinobacteria bacterium]|nr:hypothetical protein [Actinomycetota bacterium]MBW3650121.1 hypothetical protein [Actinomycetota bacterium]
MRDPVAADGFSSLGLRLTASGAMTQIAGLAVDAWLHGRDPGLAARETVFSVGNAGHLLLLGGLVLVTAGVVALLAPLPGPGPRAPMPRRRSGPATVVVVGALLLSTTAAAAAGRLVPAHDAHPGAAAARHPDLPAAGPAESGHGQSGGVAAMDAETKARLDAQLDAARALAARYATAADAVADGFSPAAPYESLIGSHYLRFSDVDNVFDVARPEMLLFDGDSPGSRLVGLSYYVVGSIPPEGFAGGADRWHQHLQTCLTPDGPAFAGDGYRRCRASGRNSWMLHAWVVDGWESPQGVFSDENARLS